MSKIKFREVKLSKDNRKKLDFINSIIEEYQEQGYRLTLRQLYYQLVSRDVIPNQTKEYSKLSTLLKEGRMGGIVDWDAIEDRLRIPSKPSSFDSPLDILNAAINQYQKPRMKGQPVYIEVWVEKDALSGVLKRVTERFHIPIMVNRGYSSASAMFDAYNRFDDAWRENQSIRILYLGDYDPSGIDMIRDIKDRIVEFFCGAEDCTADDLIDQGIDFEIIPVALTRAQINQYNPPPNPAKRTDPRAKDFITNHGTTSWEVDALRPEVLNRILTDAINKHIDRDIYSDIVAEEKKDIKKLKELTANFE